MAGLQRFDNQKLIVKFVAGLILVMLVLGVFAFALRSSGAEPDSTEAPPVGVEMPSSDGNAGSEPASSSGGGSAVAPDRPPAAGPGSGAADSPPSAVSDPDTPVSSDDPLPAPVVPVPADPSGIDSFEECAAAGYPIAESYPEQCFVPGGRGFTRQI